MGDDPALPPTVKAYLEDTYLWHADATLLGVLPLSDAEAALPAVAGAPEGASLAALALDRTVFHAQGGGQPSDRGLIRPAGDAGDADAAAFHVCIVRSGAGGVLRHIGYFPAGCGAPGAGAAVSLAVDGEWRMLSARCHSAGHAIDVAVAEVAGGALAAHKAYHFPDGPYVEYSGKVPEVLRESFPARLNEALGRLLGEDIPTEVRELPPAAAREACGGGDADFSHIGAPTVRVVTVGGACACPCGGTHVRNVSEIGGVVVTRVKSKKGKVKVSYRMVD